MQSVQVDNNMEGNEDRSLPSIQADNNIEGTEDQSLPSIRTDNTREGTKDQSLTAIQTDSNMEGTEDQSLTEIQTDNAMEGTKDQSLPCTMEYDLSGDPEVLPRVADEYQAVIPPLVDSYDQLQPQAEILPSVDAHVQLQTGSKQGDCADTVHVKNLFLVGLAVPISWSNDEVDKINRMLYFNQFKSIDINSNSDAVKLKFDKLDTSSGGRKDTVGSLYVQSTFGDNKMDVVSGSFPLPDSAVQSWTNLERDSFLLALYVFGKNFILVRKFVESKRMGDVLGFYYGKFYGSREHRRWSDCWKLRSKRCICGQSILIGWRQEELLSRLCYHLCDECKKYLHEISGTFGDGKISFEEYVFSLKETVGVRLLVEAVAIGKGKRDLTRTSLEPMKTNCAFSARPEIPVGKACSSLSTEDIIKFLTGGFRLSKARSSDLFWEAVWPRLLARGWHSEQPKDLCFPASKNSLVFLMPGIKKFSRKKLVKGNHYFDSVSDVLNKVASDPGLLELNMEQDKDNENKEKVGYNLPVNGNQDGSSNEQSHQFLQPRNKRDLMKFTIVDTSLGDEERPSKVRSLRCLPAEVLGGFISSSESSEVKGSSEESKDETHEPNTMKLAQAMADNGVQTKLSACTTGTLNNGMLDAFEPTECMVDDHDTQDTSAINDKEQTNMMTYQSTQEQKSALSSHSDPTTRRLDLVACSHKETSCSAQKISTDYKFREPESDCQSISPDLYEERQANPADNPLSANIVEKDSPKESSSGLVSPNCSSRELTLEKPEPQATINLDTPSMSPTSSNMVLNDDSHENLSSFTSETSQKDQALDLSGCATSTEQQPILNSRRQSTRNRPLTIKALEALEFGFLDPKKKRKGDNSPTGTSSSKRSRRVRARTNIILSSYTNAGNNIAESGTKETNTTEVSSNEADTCSKSQF